MKYLNLIRMIMITFALIQSMPQSTRAEIEALKPFTTDYCTGFMNGTSANPSLWKHCCVEHDLYFWAGGCNSARKDADHRIYECVKATGAPHYAWVMYLGIRLGSYSPVKIKDGKWGNGWSDGHADHLKLSNEDISTIEAKLTSNPSPDLSPIQISSFLENLRQQACKEEAQK